METKPTYQSKLNATGAVLAALGVLEVLSESPVIPEAAMPYILLVGGILVVFFRTFLTTAKLEIPEIFKKK